MIPYEVDPSLHPAQPAPAQLDDGCSPPGGTGPALAPAAPAGHDPAHCSDPTLWAKSEF
ncbi:MAG TPA: hypothetical protein VFE82_11585 [Ramlibacter sp.]|jgi:hypothetical protein|uniref:hypothetical protein n=1 Tax=Ramlibacter sp. TaxID=1917967 RepID=UPI002D5BB647|nr:hypothetical protein [Ramlibacter sp.]HZY19113.1 hypothetical protein [Ramlibacter sp.]